MLVAHACRHRRVEVVITGLALLALILGVCYSESLRPPWLGSPPADAQVPEDVPTWLNNLQAVLGASTLLVAAFVWFGELREDWETSLPCRMSVYFFHDGRPVIVCRHVWLAGASDLRAWGQQVGAQAVGERFLDFTPDIVARPPELSLLPDGTACRHYAVRFLLTRQPERLAAEPARARYQNMIAAQTAVRTEAVESVAALPDVASWGMPTPQSSPAV
ncbi:MAG: hypothetical protein M5U12_09455 [Verrucomicrobia bacterium]|nr:hypothetical protein [Verrucomicrobiota bacterium]